MITLITGGVRSGKSSFAEEIAYFRGGSEVIYLATAEVKDEEMKERVEKHRQNRPQEWTTIEESYRISKVLSTLASGQVVLLDCITVLISNFLLQGEEVGTDEEFEPIVRETEIMAEIEAIISVVRKMKLDLIIVTNEVGFGLVPSYKLGRVYRDIVGRVNQFLAKAADEVYITFAGLPVEIKEIGMKNIDRFRRKKD